MGQRREGAGAGDADPEFELCYLDADGSEHRELPAAWPGLRPETFMPAREFRWARSQEHLPGFPRGRAGVADCCNSGIFGVSAAHSLPVLVM